MAGQELGERERNPDCASYRPLSLSMNLKSEAYMKYILSALLALSVAGCETRVQVESKPKPSASSALTTVATTVELTDKQKIGLLRTEARKRGLKWRVYCTGESPDGRERFQAEAVPKGAPFTWYIEEGSKGIWAETAWSQADAAFVLYQSIIRNPSEKPEHSMHHGTKMCPPELRGQ